MPVQLNGATSGSVTIQATAVAGSSVLTLPAVTDTVATKTNPTFIGTVTAPTLVANTVTATNAINMGSSFMRNRFINGAMQVDQRNAGASGTTIGVYTVDRWGYAATQSTKGTWGQNLNSVTTAAGFPNYLGFQSSSAYSVGAGDYFLFYQPIEGYNFADLGFGTASAQTVTISFSVYSSLTGTFGGSLRNSAGTRSYPFTYLINTANTWTSISVTIPGDTSGTWVGSTNAGAAYVYFGIGVGSTFSSGTAWASANYLSATGAVSVVGTLNATFYITGVQLEPGSIATPFERRPINEVLAQCQRYFYSATNGYGLGYTPAAGPTRAGTIVFPTQMRTAPTLAGSGITYSNSSALTFESSTINGCGFAMTIPGAGGFYVNFSYTSTAEL